MGLKANTKIKKDWLGLYVNAGGCIARPFWGTVFKEGDKVRSHHFKGEMAAVTTTGNTFRKGGKYEYWSTTGIIAFEYKEMVRDKRETVEKLYEWYKENSEVMKGMIERHNKEFTSWLNSQDKGYQGKSL